MAKFPRFRPGQTFGLRGPGGELLLDKRAADLLNLAAAEMTRLGNVSVAAPLRWAESSDGRKFACDLDPEIMAKLSGAGNPYSFVQQQYDKATNTWSDMAGGRTGDNCYESKGKAGLAGKVVPITWTAAGDWRFQWVGYGCNFTFTLRGCYDCGIPGADVDFLQGGVVVYSTTTNASGVASYPGSTSGSFDIEWSLPGTPYSGTAAVDCSSPNALATITAGTGTVCYSSCALPQPASLFVTDDAGTRALGACVPYDYFGFPWTAITTMTSVGTCASPRWRVVVGGMDPFDGPVCPGFQLHQIASEHIAACGSPFLITGNYGNNSGPGADNHALANTDFTIHE